MDALMSFLSRTGLSVSVKEGLEEALSRHAGGGISLMLEAVSEMTHGQFARQLPDAPVLVALSCVPADRKAYLHIDAIIAHLLIDRLLGGNETEAMTARSLTDTEEGVLQYLLLKLLEHVYRVSGKDARIQFRFERFIGNVRAFEELDQADAPIVALTFRLEMGDHLGFAKLAVPHPLIEAAFLAAAPAQSLSDKEIAERLQHIRTLGTVRTTMWAEAGRITLTPSELAGVEEGDVILFDETDLVLHKGGDLGGRAVVRIGMGEHGGFVTTVTSDEQAVHCRLEQQL